MVEEILNDFYKGLDDYIEFCDDKPGTDWRLITGYQILSYDMLNVLRQRFINMLAVYNEFAGATNRPVQNQETGEIIIF